MARQLEMFPKLPAVRTVRMHVVNAGSGRNGGKIAWFACRCGHQSGWQPINSVSEAKRGIPCPKCNASLPQLSAEEA